VFILWLRNQHYCTHDVIWIYPTMKVWEPKHAVKINFMKISTKIMHTLYIHTFRKCSITWSQFVWFIPNQRWLICHSMDIYASCDSNTDLNGGLSLDFEVTKALVVILHHFIPSKPLLLQWLFNLPLVAQGINFCVMPDFSLLGQVGWPYRSIFY